MVLGKNLGFGGGFGYRNNTTSHQLLSTCKYAVLYLIKPSF